LARYDDVARQECKEGIFRRGELLGIFMARKLYRWLDRQYDQEYWGRKMEMIMEEEEIEEENSGVREWTEEDNNEMGNIVDPYYKL